MESHFNVIYVLCYYYISWSIAYLDFSLALMTLLLILLLREQTNIPNQAFIQGNLNSSDDLKCSVLSTCKIFLKRVNKKSLSEICG